MPSLRSPQALWWIAPGIAEVRPAADRSGQGWELAALFSGVSQGTERRVGAGQVPPETRKDMACLHMEGTFDFPVKYGYSMVGRVLSGPMEGRTAFVMHPHQDRFWASPEWIKVLPAGIPAARATLFANLETALTATWDAAPRLGEKITVVGGGVLGTLTAWLCSRLPAVELQLLERDPERRELLRRILPELQVVDFLKPGEADLSIHASSTGEGLQQALDSVGHEGRVLELSWHGSQAVALNLGGAFHLGRKRILSSQVSYLPSDMSARWDAARRTDAVLRLLADPFLDRWITATIDFQDLPAHLCRPAPAGLQTVVRYG